MLIDLNTTYQRFIRGIKEGEVNAYETEVVARRYQQEVRRGAERERQIRKNAWRGSARSSRVLRARRTAPVCHPQPTGGVHLHVGREGNRKGTGDESPHPTEARRLHTT
jgi:hypothetical protein